MISSTGSSFVSSDSSTISLFVNIARDFSSLSSAFIVPVAPVASVVYPSADSSSSVISYSAPAGIPFIVMLSPFFKEILAVYSVNSPVSFVILFPAVNVIFPVSPFEFS